MKQPILLTALIFSVLTINAQNLTNNSINEQVAFNAPIQQQSINYTNNIDVQVQSNNRGNSSAMQSFGNNKTNKPQVNNVKVTQQKINKAPVQTNVSEVVNGGTANTDLNINDNNPSNPITNNDEQNFIPYRGNVFQSNQNTLDNVGNENVNRGNRGGNILVNDINDSNPVINDSKKVVASKPVVKEYQGLDFKPSGLSGRDYSGGGKLKKGQKNFYIAHVTKHKTIHKKKPSFKKVKHHTSKCAKW